MVPLLSLVIPILVSAAIVFVVSSIIHMLLPFHRNDFRKLPKEDEVMDALRGFNLPPGDYAVPCAFSPASMKDPQFLEKMSDHKYTRETVRQFTNDAAKALEMMMEKVKVH